MEMLIILLLVGTVLGVITAAIASHKGRNVVGWFFIGLALGFLLSIIGAIIALAIILPSKNLRLEREQQMQVQSEQHRLREQLRQERMKNETFRRYALGRIDNHDQLLGTDTRTVAALPGAQADGSPSPQDVFVAPQNDQEAAVWYYHVNGQTVGPTSLRLLKTMLQSRHLAPATLVWCEDLGQWTAANQVPALF